MKGTAARLLLGGSLLLGAALPARADHDLDIHEQLRRIDRYNQDPYFEFVYHRSGWAFSGLGFPGCED